MLLTGWSAPCRHAPKLKAPLRGAFAPPGRAYAYWALMFGLVPGRPSKALNLILQFQLFGF